MNKNTSVKRDRSNHSAGSDSLNGSVNNSIHGFTSQKSGYTTNTIATDNESARFQVNPYKFNGSPNLVNNKRPPIQKVTPKERQPSRGSVPSAIVKNIDREQYND